MADPEPPIGMRSDDAVDNVTRVAIFGDIQGHRVAFETALHDLGVHTGVNPGGDQTGAEITAAHVPDGLTVVQVGDLIHKGPESDQVVAMADRLLDASPQNYVQLIGNHEGQYLGGPTFWPDMISDTAAVVLAGWFVDRRCAIAAVVEVDGAELLVTHGGMTVAKWQSLGEPTAPIETAAALNDEFWTNPALALMPGAMLYGEAGPPGVAWSEPINEFYLPWIAHGAPPFGQIHGHASPFNWSGGNWWRGVPRKLRKTMTFDRAARHTFVDIGGAQFVGVDTANGANDGNLPIVPFGQGV